MNIYVGNLSFKTTEISLRTVFAAFGTVSTVRIVTDKFTGRSKGFGFVEMPDAGEGAKAITGTDQQELDGRPLRVNEARPQENEPGTQRQR